MSGMALFFIGFVQVAFVHASKVTLQLPVNVFPRLFGHPSGYPAAF